MNIITKTILAVSLVLVLSCIDKYKGEPLTIRNNTSGSIYYWYSYWTIENFSDYHYPDTILPFKLPIDIGYIGPNNATGSGDADPNWEQIFSELKEGIFSVYFFEELPESQSDWDLIRQNYSLYRKDVTYQEFVNNNYQVIYP